MILEATFFATAAAFRKWLARHHERATELLVGFYKKGSGRPSIDWPESVDQALCYGWIDGVRRRIDDESYCIRFTPRKRVSNWSAINIRRVEELAKLGLMQPAGERAFALRRDDKSRIYAYENAVRALAPADEERFRENAAAWEFWSAQPAGYRRVALNWIVTAKRDETRARRLATLIEDSANARRLGVVTLQPRKA